MATLGRISAVPIGTEFPFRSPNPALKRWAIVFRPVGLEPSCAKPDSRPTPRTVRNSACTHTDETDVRPWSRLTIENVEIANDQIREPSFPNRSPSASQAGGAGTLGRTRKRAARWLPSATCSRVRVSMINSQAASEPL